MSSYLPAAFSSRMKSNLGDQFQLFEDAISGNAPTSVRINTSKETNLTHLNLEESILWNPYGHYLKERPVFTLDPLFHAGAYYVQEASSMSIIHALRQWIDVDGQPLRILDLCAAPGGKTTSLTALGDQHLIVANEVIKQRYGILYENMERWGSMNKVITNHDVKDFEKLKGYFDVVLVDAPCSGEGLFRKDPKACAEWSPDNVNLCADRQKRILAGAQQLVKEDGILVYCTCTYNDQENIDNVQWLTDQFDLESLPAEFDHSWNIVSLNRQDHYGYQFYPHRVNGEGFFLSGFRKTKAPSWKLKKDKKAPKGYYQKLSKQSISLLGNYIETDHAVHYFQNPHSQISMIGMDWWNDIQMITELLRKNTPGVAVGEMKRDQFVPAHGIAMAYDLDLNFPKLDLDKANALLFLKKEPFNVDAPETGWHLVRYQGLNLGWVKVLPNRINNYLPKHLRIRMSL